MSSFITTAPLASTEIEQAYPLARSLMPGVDPAEWARLARALVDPAAADERGILTVRNQAGSLPIISSPST
jgi:hypothetical protein